MTAEPSTEPTAGTEPSTGKDLTAVRKAPDPAARRLPAWRIGITGGLVGILCCVGPTVLALFGVVGAGTAFVWATELYDGYAWWFRLAGLVVMVALIAVALRHRGMCSITGVRRLRWRLLSVLVIGVVTYAVLYGVTTWLGALAR